MAKKKHHEEHENHERWLVSYADFITLLFAFFVVMYAVSRVDNKKLIQVTESIKWAMHFEGSGGVGQMPIFDGPLSQGGNVMGMPGGPLNTTPDMKEMESIRRNIEESIKAFVIKREGLNAVTVVLEDQRVTVRLAAADFFDPGQAALRPQILPVLDAIAGEIVPLERPLRVEGHTDDTPVTGSRFHDNWDLSAARAATVASYLERAHRTSPALLSATGFASSRPLSTASTPEARELNRRVEIVMELDVKASRPRQREVPRMEPIGK